MESGISSAGKPAGAQGVGAAVQAYAASVARYFSAFFGLLHLEAREAAGVYLRVFVFVVAGLIFAVFGYVFFLLFLAFLCGVLFGLEWYWIALAYSVAHFLLVAFCAWRVREGVKKPVFSALSQEVGRDVAMLAGEPFAVSGNAVSGKEGNR